MIHSALFGCVVSMECGTVLAEEVAIGVVDVVYWK